MVSQISVPRGEDMIPRIACNCQLAARESLNLVHVFKTVLLSMADVNARQC